jgi:hypothetical protein
MIVYKLVGSAMVIALMTTGLAVAEPPSRNGNIWGGVAHQPTPSIVRSQEKAAGLQPSPQDETRQDEAVERLGRELLKQR